MKKNTKKQPTTATDAPKPATKPRPEAPVVTLATIEFMLDAPDIDSAVRVLFPASAARLDATYRFNRTCDKPLPARRGATLKVLAAAVRLGDRPFKLADITTALPELKGARFHVNRLVRSGHFTVVTE